MTSLAQRVYAAAHQISTDRIGPNDLGFQEVCQVLAEHAATIGEPPHLPPPRRMLCAVCIGANRRGETTHIHEAMTSAQGAMVCHEHFDILVDALTLGNALTVIDKRGAERRRDERRQKYEQLQSELYQRMREQEG